MDRVLDYPRYTHAVPGLILLLAVIAFAGCTAPPQRQYVEGFDNGRERMALDAYDVVLAMRQAGFNDEQVLEHGPTLRNAIATHGAARIRSGKFTQAMFMVQDGELYAVSHRQGTFRYQPAESYFKSRATEAASKP